MASRSEPTRARFPWLTSWGRGADAAARPEQAQHPSRPRMRTWHVGGIYGDRMVHDARAALHPYTEGLGAVAILPRANDLVLGQRYVSLDTGEPPGPVDVERPPRWFLLRAVLALKGVSFREVGTKTRLYLDACDELVREQDEGHRSIYLPWSAGPLPAPGDRLEVRRRASAEPLRTRDLRAATAEAVMQISARFPHGSGETPAFDHAAVRKTATIGVDQSRMRWTFDPSDRPLARELLAEELGGFRLERLGFRDLVGHRAWDGDAFVVDVWRDGSEVDGFIDVGGR